MYGIEEVAMEYLGEGRLSIRIFEFNSVVGKCGQLSRDKLCRIWDKAGARIAKLVKKERKNRQITSRLTVVLNTQRLSSHMFNISFCLELS